MTKALLCRSARPNDPPATNALPQERNGAILHDGPRIYSPLGFPLLHPSLSADETDFNFLLHTRLA
jgi:hypothetical protein